MQLIEVTDKRHAREFLLLPVRLYKGVKNWIRPLDQDVEQVFDPKKNKKFRHGEAIRWILQDDEGRTIGRVAAFVDRKTATRDHPQPTGGMGFFECVNDREAAFRLFDACKAWLEERGMEAMDGPINFGDRDRWWGLLIEGDYEPNYCMGYHFGYYKELFEAYGFRNFFNQYTYRRQVKGGGGVDEAVWKRAEKVLANPAYRFEHMKRGQIDRYMEYFRQIYNRAWAAHPGVAELSKAEVQGLTKQFRPIVDVKIVWFAFYQDEPVGFFIQLPEMNQVFKHLNGKLYTPVSLAKFVWHQYLAKTNRKMFGVVFGVTPEHQRKGVEAAMIQQYSKLAFSPSFQYEELELNWIGDFNPVMMKLCMQIGAKQHKTHATYRYLFDPEAPFERARRIKR